MRGQASLNYDERMQGSLQLFRTQQQLDASAQDVKALPANGVPFEVLDRDGCVRAEPALRYVRDRIVGGFLTSKNETGDCFKFTNALEQRAAALGVDLCYGHFINGLDIEAGRVRGGDHRSRDYSVERGSCRSRELFTSSPQEDRNQVASLSCQRILADNSNHRRFARPLLPCRSQIP